MPLVQISMRSGQSEAYRQALFDSLYRAMRESYDVPEDDQFMTIREHEAANFRYSPTCLGIARSDYALFIQLTVSNTRTLEQKKALFRQIAQRLGESPGVRPEDVFINLVEVDKANWSFGHGLAQYVEAARVL
ncbi:MAG TPA: tautomerase family protein [Microvirga sp.]|jgi:phenylpyruvate tautomerase PptA (4-oxalocrotonate tautomerase family)|nr:tautomerase family protein [Microvirga sp.]